MGVDDGYLDWSSMMDLVDLEWSTWWGGFDVM